MAETNAESDFWNRPPTPIPWNSTPEASIHNIEDTPASTTDLNRLFVEALQPDPGTAVDFNIPHQKFAFSVGLLNKLLNPKSLAAFAALGGLEGLEKGLRTDRSRGLNVDEGEIADDVSFEQATAHVLDDFRESPKSSPAIDISRRRLPDPKKPHIAYKSRYECFGDGRLPRRYVPRLWHTAGSFCRLEVAILSIASLSMILGLYQDLRTRPTTSQTKDLWKQNAAVVILMFLLILLISSQQSYCQMAWTAYRQSFDQTHMAAVVRSGKLYQIPWVDVLVGDLVQIRPGDRIWADGVIVRSLALRCDESSATGESDTIRKQGAEWVYSQLKHDPNYLSSSTLDPFVISGATVLHGAATYLVTATGINSSYGKIMMSLMEDTYRPKTASRHAWVRVWQRMIATLLFLIQFIKFLVSLKRTAGTSFDAGLRFLQLLQLCLVTLMLGPSHWAYLTLEVSQYWYSMHTNPRTAIKNIHSLSVIHKVSTVCVNLPALFDYGASKVEDALIINHSCTDFVVKPSDEVFSAPVGDQQPVQASASTNYPAGVVDDIPALWKECMRTIYCGTQVQDGGSVEGDNSLLAILTKLGATLSDSKLTNPTQDDFTWADFPYANSRAWYNSVALTGNVDGSQRAFFVGDPLTILESCSKLLGWANNESGTIRHPGSEWTAKLLAKHLSRYTSQGRIPLAFAYHDNPDLGDNHADEHFDQLKRSLVFIGILNVKMELRVGVTDTIKACQNAGVSVRLLTTGDRRLAEFFARQCGVLPEQGKMVSMEYSDTGTVAERRRMVPNACVVSSDLQLFVQDLRKLNETVMTVSTGAELRAARPDVSLIVGPGGPSSLRDGPEIVSDDGFVPGLLDVILAGRAFEQNQKKFVLFALILAAVLVPIIFFTAAVDKMNQPILSIPQLILIHLLFALLGCLLLGSDPPNVSCYSRKPTPRISATCSLSTFKVLFVQSLYQLAVVFVLTYGTPYVFRRGTPEAKSALVFCTFMWMQIFTLVGLIRQPKSSGQPGFHKRILVIIAIVALIILATILVSLFGGQTFGIRRLRNYHWAISVVLGLFSPVIGAIARRIPDQVVSRVIPRPILTRYFQAWQVPPPDEVDRWTGTRNRRKDENEYELATFLVRWIWTRLNGKLDNEADAEELYEVHEPS